MRRVLSACALLALASPAAADGALDRFRREVEPLLREHCYDCHGDGARKGGVQLDGFTSEAALHDPQLWLRVLRNTRARIMPPADEDTLAEADIARLGEWIKRDAFQLDPARPDPGRVTVRRLNRVEYRNTVRDLLGVEFDTLKEFPADDTGHGFDNIGDVLTISPMLLEKYLDAAQRIVADAVPTAARVVAARVIEGRRFATVRTEASPAGPGPRSADDGAPAYLRPPPAPRGDALDLSYYTPVVIEAKHHAEFAGRYQLVFDFHAVEKYVDDQFDYNRCRLVLAADGETLLDREFVREGEGRLFRFTFDRDWAAGDHRLTLEIRPVGPDREQKRQLRLRFDQVTVRGPFEEKHWVRPDNYAQFFPRPVPRRAAARLAYARELLADFSTRAFRRPVDDETVDRLARMALSAAGQPGGTFEAGVAQAMTAVLASPRFLFREEDVLPVAPGAIHPQVDEYALASRLSYFLWSSMPDAELFRLARAGQLRAQLPAQVARLLRDPKAGEFIRNFTGQWLEARDIANVQINALAIHLRERPDPAVEQALASFRRINVIPEERRTVEQRREFEEARQRFFAFARSPRPQLTPTLREAMQQETELTFGHVLHEDRSLLELIDANYTFLNEELAAHYGIPGVTGRDMRRVTLPPGSPRGGVLTQGTVLAVTSNPSRTSPVKRGVFILNAILGTPPAPPPPNVPPLEEAPRADGPRPSLREALAEHAKNPLCRSCHNRMDPLGLALENFNALGAWRETDLGLPVQPAGRLITGEEFKDIRELKHILATAHRRDFYACLSEKLLTYALGRGLDYRDTDTLDGLVEVLEKNDGRPSALLQAIVASVPFQQRRAAVPATTAHHATTPGPRG